LVYKIRDYYYTERMYLLQCFKVIINFWQDDMHAYKVCILNKKFFKKLEIRISYI